MDENTKDNVHLQIVAERLTSLHSDVNDLKTSVRDSMKEVATAVTKLVQMEERQMQGSQAVERVFKATEENQKEVKELNKRITELERDAPKNKETSEWIKGIMYGAVGLCAMFIAKKVGLI
jgi:chromosome segregation ATPase